MIHGRPAAELISKQVLKQAFYAADRGATEHDLERDTGHADDQRANHQDIFEQHTKDSSTTPSAGSVSSQ